MQATKADRWILDPALSRWLAATLTVFGVVAFLASGSLSTDQPLWVHAVSNAFASLMVLLSTWGVSYLLFSLVGFLRPITRPRVLRVLFWGGGASAVAGLALAFFPPTGPSDPAYVYVSSGAGMMLGASSLFRSLARVHT